MGRSEVRALSLLALCALAGCASPSQRNPARYGTVRSWFPPTDWSSSNLENLRVALRDAEALGPAFVVAASEAASDVTVAHWIAPANCVPAARFVLGGRVVELDPVCLPGLLYQRAALIHELGHWLGMSHVCERSNEEPWCSSVGIGGAVMNPSFTFADSTGPTFNGAYTGPAPWFQPTDLDLAEFRRVRP